MSFDLNNFKAEPSPASPEETEVENHESDDQEADYSTNENAGKILHHWKAPEFEVYEKSPRWYLIFGIFIALLVVYALITNAPIMAITFILAGIVGYIYLQKDPRIITFSITSKGVIADKEMYQYDNIHSFWIFYDPPHTKTICLHTKASMLPLIHIPLLDQDPVMLRELLMRNIPEIKQDPGLIDAIERVLHI